MSPDPSTSKTPPGKPAPAEDPVTGAAGGRRRLVEIRCGFAEMAREEATAAEVRAAEAKRLYDEQAAVVAEAQAAVDLAGANAAKDEAHRAFRAAAGAARSKNQVEAAATAWLDDINKINVAGRAGQARVRLERDVADALRSDWTRLSDMAEASAAMADSAMAACRAARMSVTAEADGAPDSAGLVKVLPEAPAARVEPPLAATETAAVPSMKSAPTPEEPPPASDRLAMDLRSPEPQVVVQLLRREGKTLNGLVARLAGSDATTRSRWGLLLSSFVDSVVAAATDDACMVFPADNAFWSQFTLAQGREVVRGLAALGFRYDGFEGFADGRVPTHRDLSMAVGNAGLLPARVHDWPKPDEAETLFRGVRVAGDEYLAAHAPSLTLGELVRVLGRRAELLSDLWNDWDDLRPILLGTTL